MEGEPDVLQQGIEPHSLRRRRRQALERVRTEQQEGVETERNHPLCGERRVHRSLGQPPFDGCNQRARQPHDHDPQQHRAFVVAPGARKLEDQRLHRVRIRGDQLHREVGDRKQPDEHGEGEGDQRTLHHGGRTDQTGKFARAAFAHRHEPRNHLQRGQCGGEPQGGKTELRNHSIPTVVSSAIFAAWCCSMSCNSRGT